MLRTYIPHLFLKIFSVRESCILDLSPVVIYGVYGVAEKGCDMGRLGDTQLYQGKDSKLRRKQFTILDNNPAVLFQKRVEIIDE